MIVCLKIVSMKKEVWKIIERFPTYEVSNHGRVRRACDSLLGNYKKGRLLSPRYIAGYPAVLFLVGDPAERVFKNFTIANLVCEAFHGPKPSPKHCVAHWDGNKKNSHYKNLRWATYAENSKDTIRHGKTFRGIRHRDAKLTPVKVRKLRKLMEKGCPLRATARKYGVTYQALQEIRAGRNWAWLK